MVLGKLDKYIQKNETRPLFTPHTRINSKWIKDLNVRPKTIKILEENISSKILNIAHSNYFTGCISPRQGKTKKKNKQMGQHQTFAQQRKNINKIKKTTHRMGKHICQYI